MTEKELRKKITLKFRDVDYEIINFRVMREPADFKCLKCNNIIHFEHLQNLFRDTKTNFCPFCSNSYKGSHIGKKLTIEESQKRLDEAFGGEYEILKDKYNGWSKKGLIRHTLCGKIFLCQPRDLLYHSHCPCYTITSKGESEVEKVLTEMNIIFEKQKRLEDMKKAPFDFYLPDYNLLIEFQGRQHYEPVPQFGGEKQFIIQQEIDKRKKEVAQKAGYELLEISYKDKSLIKDILVRRLSVTGVGLSNSKCHSPQDED